jgi:dipeptidyl aminopeptidase/acylaminoacyl peptidase
VVAPGDFAPPAISPDGRLFAYIKTSGEGNGRTNRLVAQAVDGASKAQEMDASPLSYLLDWTPDGRHLAYLDTEGGRRVLYMQSLGGGAPVTLMHFDDEPKSILSYAWSTDGEKIAVTRGKKNTDVVLFTDLH